MGRSMDERREEGEEEHRLKKSNNWVFRFL